MNFLYRALNEYEVSNGMILSPRSEASFVDHLYPPFTPPATVGLSQRNAIKNHQVCSKTFKTRGVSTTVSFEIALGYALHNSEREEKRIIVVIERDSLNNHHVEEFVVSDHVCHSDITKPRDCEVILTHPENGPLPKEVIYKLLEII